MINSEVPFGKCACSLRRYGRIGRGLFFACAVDFHFKWCKDMVLTAGAVILGRILAEEMVFKSILSTPNVFARVDSLSSLQEETTRKSVSWTHFITSLHVFFVVFVCV